MAEETSRITSEVNALQTGKFTGEEGGDERSTPAKNLGGAVVIGGLGIYAMGMSLTFDSPDTVFTAPGLLPFLTGLTLLLMCIALGIKAFREGGAEDMWNAPLRGFRLFWADDEGRRALQLMSIVFLYVLLVALIEFEWSIPTPWIELKLSSYEVVSFVIITFILRMLWKKSWLRCFIVTFIMVEALASIFRYAFHILMPAVG